MSRSDDFKELAACARALADLADVQKDTVDWWTKYGETSQDLFTLFAKCEPKKDTHRSAAQKAMVERGIKQSKERSNASS